MRLEFIPGNLLLVKADDGTFRVSVGGQEFLRTKAKGKALGKFKEIRKQMEERFPPTELSAEEKAETFKRRILDSMVQHNSLGGRKKKSTAGGTRTFGG